MAFLGRIWPPRISREQWFWGGLTGIGVSFVASTLLQVPITLLRYLNLREAGDALVYADSVVAIAVVAVGVAVAWRAAGPRAVALYLAVHLAYTLAALPGTVIFCDRSGETNCVLRLAIGQWQVLAGLIVGTAVAVAFRSGEQGGSPVLHAAGLFVAVQRVLSVPMGFVTFGLVSTPDGPGSGESLGMYLLAIDIAAAVAAGAVLGLRSARRSSLALFAGLILIDSFPGILANVPISRPMLMTSVLAMLAQLVALLAAYVAAQRRVGGLRAAVVVLLVWAAYWAALPWIDCTRQMSLFGDGVQMCTFGFPFAAGNTTAGYWPNVLVGVVYLVVAALVVTRRRPI